MVQTKTRVEIGTFATLPINAGQVIIVGEQEIALYRLSNGEVYAVENKSPHPKGGTLADGLISGKFLYCPVYDWKISLETGEVQAPDEGKVRTFDVQFEREQLVLYL